MKARINAIAMKIVIRVVVKATTCSHCNVTFNVLSGFLYILRQACHFKHWFFVSAWCYNIGVGLLLNPFNGGPFWSYNKSNYSVRDSHLYSYLSWSIWAQGACWGQSCAIASNTGHTRIPTRCPDLAEVFCC